MLNTTRPELMNAVKGGYRGSSARMARMAVTALTDLLTSSDLLSLMPKSTKSANRKAPWKKAAPKSASHTHLSPAQKARAKRSAKRAGRPYPNLVDNMQAAKGSTTRSKRGTKSRRKTS